MNSFDVDKNNRVSPPVCLIYFWCGGMLFLPHDFLHTMMRAISEQGDLSFMSQYILVTNIQTAQLPGKLLRKMSRESSGKK